MALTGKRRKFVDQYFLCNMNQTKAAIAAGYSEASAYNQGSRLMKNDEVARAIKERMNAMAMEADEVLYRIASHARGSADDVTDENGDLDITKARETGAIHLIKSITKTEISSDSFSKKEVKFEMYDAQSALVQIMKVHSLTTKSQVEHDVTIKGYENVSPDDWDDDDTDTNESETA